MIVINIMLVHSVAMAPVCRLFQVLCVAWSLCQHLSVVVNVNELLQVDNTTDKWTILSGNIDEGNDLIVTHIFYGSFLFSPDDTSPLIAEPCHTVPCYSYLKLRLSMTTLCHRSVCNTA